MGRLFGTDGIRGIANKDLTPELALKLGQAVAQIFKDNERKKIVVGKDPRISSDLLESSLIAGICSAGVDVFKVGVMPTPGIAYLTHYYHASAGAVISASHNSAEFNGIKFFGESGFKLSDEKEDEIEKHIEEGMTERLTGSEIGRIFNEEDAKETYEGFLKKTIDTDFEGLKIAVDCANGATSEIAPQILEELGVKIIPINNKPNGININLDCGSLHPEIMADIVRSNSVDAGLCFDGDGDRVIMVDENGDVVDGDFIMTICAAYLKKEGSLKNNKVVATVMSNLGFDLAMKKLGIDIFKTKVGDRFVLRKMIEEEAVLGGEQSGHIIFLNYINTGDGILTALQMLSILKKSNKPLSEWRKLMRKFPQVLINVKIKDKEKYKDNKAITSLINKKEEELNGKGRILVRPSGTEPLIRVMVEAETQEIAENIGREIAGKIKQDLG
ncbi:MAG: phosphoglucosamine mutase [Actinomycetia bacterium]|nr:phosphoglucosamine mutase [Actinomycetes bacterium]